MVGSMIAFQAIIAIFFSLSLETAITRFFWDYTSQEKRRRLIGSLTLIIISIASIIIVILFLANKYVAQIYSSIQFYPYYSYAILYTYLMVIPNIFKIYLRMSEKALNYVVLSFLETVLLSSLILWFVVGLGEGAKGMLKGYLYGGILVCPVYIVFLSRVSLFVFDKQIIKDALRYSLPYFLTLILNWILTFSDRIFVERFSTLRMVGVYSLAANVANILLVIGTSFTMAYEPQFFQLANLDTGGRGRESISASMKLFLLSMISIATIIGLFTPEAVRLFFDVRYSEATTIIPLLVLGIVISQGYGLTGFFIKQSKKMKENFYIASIQACCYLGLNFILVPYWGMKGAAVTVICSTTLGFLLQYSYCKRHCYFIPFPWKDILPLFSFSILLILFFVYFNGLSLLLSVGVKIGIVVSLVWFFVKPKLMEAKQAIVS
ncbi:MAG: oligosaccharide flippase family protein [Bacteroidota bacterium]